MAFPDDDDFDDEAFLLSKQIQDGVPTTVERPHVERISDDQLNDKIIQDATELIQQGLEAIATLKARAVGGADADTIAAFAGLMSSTTGAIETLSKISASNAKTKAARQLERLRHKHKLAQIAEKAKLPISADGINGNTLTASREDIINLLLRPPQQSPLKQATVVEPTEQTDQ